MSEDSEIKELAKATAEVAKLGTKGLDCSEKFSSYLAKVFKVPIEEAIGLFGDHIKYVRWKGQLRLVEKALEFVEGKKLSKTRPVALKHLLPIFEHASIEEDEDLQDMWARLLSNAMDPDFKHDIRSAYIDIIKNIEPIDALILKTAYDDTIDQSVLSSHDGDILQLFNSTQTCIAKSDILDTTKVKEVAYYNSIHNLFRVECLTPFIEDIYTTINEASDYDMRSRKTIDASKNHEAELVRLTVLGYSFVETCIK